MRLTLSALLISSMALGGCAAVRDSRVNPFNWFGGSRSEAVATAPTEASTNPLIPAQRAGLFARKRAEREIYLGTPIDTVSDLVIERVPGGAIIRATGVSQSQGLYEVRLTPKTWTTKPLMVFCPTAWKGGCPKRHVPAGQRRRAL